MALALDGSAANNVAGGITNAVSLTTSNSGDLIYLVILTNDAGGVASVSDTAGLSWAHRATGGSAGNRIETWSAVSSGALSADSITVTFGASTFSTVCAIGISGANTATKFDSNAGLPAAGTTSPVALTTSNANDFLIGAYRFTSTASPTAGAGWTLITGANFLLVEYQIVAATQSGLSATIGTGNTDENGGIGDAVIAASGGGGGGTGDTLGMQIYRPNQKAWR